MAFSATTRPNFSFHLLNSTTQNPTSPSKPKTLPYPKNPFFLKPPRPHFISSSVDVSKDDKPISEKPQSPPPPPEDDSFPTPSEEEPKLDRRRLEERFAVLNTGIYECRSCGYLYDEAAGDPSYPIPPGLQFGKLPEDWRCPTCGAAQSFFVSKSVEIAGFAQNQQFGLGGNALTSGQKAVLIYGSLFLLFVLFLSGYFLQ
ncbi:rubredoxin-like protein [Cinnamomum micranthum f. kanehirae]|uniref:Rubredoxin-like protein n=1 Tax=Cinnamomum micranthum f. kanehirae TaxID=337451 RepID=A0A443PWL2_9MAGN|nr:rubredoxin-like protein [Cinnamomum micranthum f. kanehirae]